ncbi:MAG TPA: MFS transporter [candidate division Zixibacteria bacterium]|nr:MFS transporter [candidate division Zixibacteria bacterium]MDM7971709.1 MFS transporter [candidate division Zixibacteria bacterium]HOD65905.1 MFS transporter [candidate division Zixibacteria bacterium]HPM36050.1 MFS transporter [candidate division Zixibacteria bacterium]
MLAAEVCQSFLRQQLIPVGSSGEHQRIIEAHRHRFFLVGAIGTFMSTLDGSILNVALPTIAADLGADIHLVAWVVLAYTLTIISLMLIFGAWTERKGYDFAYRFAYSFFVLGSAACALSPSIHSLILARVVQGIGSAMFQAVGPGLVTAVFPAEQRGRGIGMMVMMVAAGLMAGPPLGGFILQFLPWQWIFVINLPIGAVGIALAARYFRLLPKPEDDRPIYLAGGAAIATALVAGTLALSMVSEHALRDWQVWAPALAAAGAFLLFLRYESRPARHMIGLDMFRNRQFSTAIAAAILMFVTMAGGAILLPFYFESVKGYGPSRIGLFLVIIPAIMFVVAPLSGRISDRIGSLFLTTSGAAVAAFGQYLLLHLDAASSDAFIMLVLAVIGLGAAIFNTPNSSSIMGSVGPTERARASSIIGTARNIGNSIGIAMATALFAYFRSRRAVSLGDPAALFVAAFHDVVKVSLGVALLTVPLCLTRHNRPRPGQGGGAPEPPAAGV